MKELAGITEPRAWFATDAGQSHLADQSPWSRCDLKCGRVRTETPIGYAPSPVSGFAPSVLLPCYGYYGYAPLYDGGYYYGGRRWGWRGYGYRAWRGARVAHYRAGWPGARVSGYRAGVRAVRR